MNESETSSSVDEGVDVINPESAQRVVEYLYSQLKERGMKIADDVKVSIARSVEPVSNFEESDLVVVRFCMFRDDDSRTPPYRYIASIRGGEGVISDAYKNGFLLKPGRDPNEPEGYNSNIFELYLSREKFIEMAQ